MIWVDFIFDDEGEKNSVLIGQRPILGCRRAAKKWMMGIQVFIRLDLPNGAQIGPGKIALLEAISGGRIRQQLIHSVCKEQPCRMSRMVQPP
jgi:hypothetical protein